MILTSLSRFNERRGGFPGGPNVSKLLISETFRTVRAVAGSLLGPDLALWGPESASGGWLQELVVFSPAPAIYGGTDQIQRNILGERVLGLPKEPNNDRTTPFAELPKNV